MYFLISLALALYQDWPVNFYASDPQPRMAQLLKNSEDMKAIQQEWDRIWFTDHPSSMVEPQTVSHQGIAKPIGRWELHTRHPAGFPFRIALDIQAERLQLVITFKETATDSGFTYSFWGDYAVTKDGVLYGVITSADPVRDPSRGSLNLEADHLFRARYRLDDGVLTIKEFKFLKEYDAVCVGRYLPMADGKASRNGPPSTAEVLRRLRAAGVAEEFSDDFKVVTERLADCYQCTVNWTETVEADYPFPFRCSRPRAAVVKFPHHSAEK